MTRATYDGQFAMNQPKSFPDADKLCATAAAAAGLGSDWQAWLWNTVTNTPSSYPQPWSPPGPGPFYAMDGVTVLFPTGASLEGFPSAPIALDEYGATVPSGETVWTGMNVGGQSAKLCCNWTDGFTCGSPPAPNTGTYGQTGTTTQSWINAGSGDCSTSRHIYCLGTAP